MDEIGQTIRAIRTAMRLKQAPFAERVGVSQSTVSKWENGRDRPEYEHRMTLAELARDVGVNPGHIIAQEYSFSQTVMEKLTPEILAFFDEADPEFIARKSKEIVGVLRGLLNSEHPDNPHSADNPSTAKPLAS